jgi:acyl-CoA thioesterase-2
MLMTANRSDAPSATTPTGPPPSPDCLVERLKTLLDVEELDRDLYRGIRQPGGRGRVFGGQVIAQGLMAATRSTDAHQVAHSLHAYFMRPGDEALPIIYRVVRDHDGRSFATRRVIAMQRGVPILNLAASFQAPESGLAHQATMPEAPPPEALIDEAEIMERYRDQIPERIAAMVLRPRPIQIRRVEARSPLKAVKSPPLALVWFRAAAPIGDDRTMHRAILAYASDMALLSTCMRPHGVSWMTHDLLTASLDHALWLHEDVAVDDWLLYATDSPWSGHARGFNRGQIFSRDGRLVASTAQEGLIRLRE